MPIFFHAAHPSAALCALLLLGAWGSAALARPALPGLARPGIAPPSVASPDALPPDSTAPPVDWSVGYDLGSLYTPIRGFGIGGRLTARHLGWPGARWTLAPLVAQRYQRLGLSLYSADPFRSRLFSLLQLYARRSAVHPFFGLGPRSREDQRVRFDFRSAEAEARLGGYVFDHSGLLLQPFARLRWDHLLETTEDADNLERLSPATQANVLPLLGERRLGVYLGLAVLTDTRDAVDYPRQGWLAQAELSRFVALDGSGLGFTQATGTLHGFFPVADLLPALRHHVAQATLYVTTRRGASSETLPFYYLATLDFETLAGFGRGRFVGRDAVVAELSYRFPVPSLLDLITDDYATDFFVSVEAGSVYDRLEDDFALRLSFDDVPATGRVPLRPAIAIGGALVNARRTDLLAAAALSLSAEGFVAAEIRLLYDLRGLRPPIR